MNLLLQNGLPDKVAGEAIRPSFRNMLQFDIALQRQDFTQSQKISAGLALLYKTLPQDTAAAVQGLVWFYNGGASTGGEGGGEGSGTRNFCFEQDARLIYAAFYATYGISLSTVDFLHWWEFLALLEGLPETTLFAQVINYRSADLRGMGKSQAEFYRRMRAKYKLKNAAAQKLLTLEERDAAFKARMAKRMETANAGGQAK